MKTAYLERLEYKHYHESEHMPFKQLDRYCDYCKEILDEQASGSYNYIVYTLNNSRGVNKTHGIQEYWI